MNHKAYINPKIIFGRERKKDAINPQTIHVNPNFPRPQTQKMYINPLFASTSAMSAIPTLPAPKQKTCAIQGSQATSKYSWKRRLTGQNGSSKASREGTIMEKQTNNVYLSPSGKKLIRKNTISKNSLRKIAAIPGGKSVSSKRLSRNQFKLDKRPSSQRRRSAQKKKFVATKSRYKIERLFPKDINSVGQQKILKSRNLRPL